MSPRPHPDPGHIYLSSFNVSDDIKTFPESTPTHSDIIHVSDLHKLYVETYGNPNGIPVITLHGGPGATAYRLHKAWTGSKLYFSENAGHASFEPTLAKALIAASGEFKIFGKNTLHNETRNLL